MFDALGSVSGLTDPAGNLTRTVAYDPYGNPTTTGTTPVYFGYASGYTDTAGLVRFGQRLYDPTQGRWTQPDPLDQTGDLTQGNRYAYAGGDPINATDPTGQVIHKAATRFVKRNAGKALSILSDLGTASSATLAGYYGVPACYAGAATGGPIGWVAGGVGCTTFAVGTAGVIGYSLRSAYQTARSIH